MAEGTDIYAGGVKYNNSSINAYGIATFVDELLAIKKMVYDDKIISLPELQRVLKSNWEGQDKLRRTALLRCSKYGVGNSEADFFTNEVIAFLSNKINNHENGRGGVFRLGLFSIDWIFELGKRLGASADGRYSGDPVSKNLSSVVGMDTKGVTGTVRSVIKQNHTLAPNGAVLDIALHPTAVSGDEGASVMLDLLKIYFGGGGFAIQMNVVSADTLIAAQANPDKYRNLQVRLCGWNVYFTDLEKDVQDNLINSMRGCE
jgi:formate C-acetyltransferase